MQADVRNLRGANFLDQRIELADIDIPLEIDDFRRVVGLGDDHIDERAPGELLVQARGGEVHVARHDVARPDRDLREDVLGAAALVGRDDVLVAVMLLHRLFEVIKVFAAGVGLVAEHHARPLPVAHRAGARVGEQVDVDVARAEQERVVARLAQRRLAIAAGGHAQRLDDLHLPRLGPRTAGGAGNGRV